MSQKRFGNIVVSVVAVVATFVAVVDCAAIDWAQLYFGFLPLAHAAFDFINVYTFVEYAREPLFS